MFPRTARSRIPLALSERIASVARTREVSESRVIREWLILGAAAAEAACSHPRVVEARCAECGRAA